MNLAVYQFLAALRAADSVEREAMIDELHDVCCLLCGEPDPECDCWMMEKVAPS